MPDDETPTRRVRRPDQTAQPDIADTESAASEQEQKPETDQEPESPVENNGNELVEEEPKSDTAPQAPVERGPEQPVVVLPYVADGVVVRDSESRIIAVCGAVHQDMGTRELLCAQLVEKLNS